jgi:hypothetical protein
MADGTLERIFNSPYMKTVHLQLKLCDYTNQQLSPYPNSAVFHSLTED